MYSELTECKKPKGYIKTRGLHCWDLLNGNKFKTSNRGGKGAHNRAFKLDIRWLAMRKQGMGLRSIELETGVNKSFIGNAFRSLDFDPISKGGHKRKSAQDIYEDEWMKEIESVKKDKTWARHPEVAKHVARKKYYEDTEAHREKVMRYRRERAEKYKAYQSGYKKKWNEENPDKSRSYVKKYNRTPHGRAMRNVRSRLRDAFRGKRGPKECGCTARELKAHLESLWTKGMSWDNYGLHGWHIDHIRPLASFNFENEDGSINKDEARRANHFTNLQPMWAKDNLAKSDNWEGQTTLAL